MKDKVLTLKDFLLSRRRKHRHCRESFNKTWTSRSDMWVSILSTHTKKQFDHLVDSLVNISNSIPF